MTCRFFEQQFIRDTLVSTTVVQVPDPSRLNQEHAEESVFCWGRTSNSNQITLKPYQLNSWRAAHDSMNAAEFNWTNVSLKINYSACVLENWQWRSCIMHLDWHRYLKMVSEITFTASENRLQAREFIKLGPYEVRMSIRRRFL